MLFYTYKAIEEESFLFLLQKTATRGMKKKFRNEDCAFFPKIFFKIRLIACFGEVVDKNSTFKIQNRLTAFGPVSR